MMVSGREAASLLRRGIFAVNKTKDITSNELLTKLKDSILEGIPPESRPFHLKMGHGGTLDRSAVGVLVVGVNWGCKKLPLMLHGAKNYVVVGQFGIATDTYNETGRVTDERPYGKNPGIRRKSGLSKSIVRASTSHVRECDLQAALKTFVGDIWQVAPLYSALKYEGRRLSDLVRAGVDVEPKERKVRCYSAECTDYSPPFFTLHVRCGGGFYIRSLVHDLGIALSTCAHVRQLQRTQQGPFTLHDCLNEQEWTFSQIIDSILLCQLKFSQYENRLKNTM